MDTLLPQLQALLGRPLRDQTGATGYFDFELNWAQDSPENGNLDPNDANRSSLIRALREQLGIEVRSTAGSVEVVVVDHVERPSAN